MSGGMRLLLAELGVVIEVIGADRPGHPPWRIATPPPARLRALTRRRFPTLEALTQAVHEHCHPEAP